MDKQPTHTLAAESYAPCAKLLAEMLFDLTRTACLSIPSQQELHDQPLMKGSSDESTRTERRPGEGGEGLPTDWSAEDRKPDVAEILEAEATTIDIAEQAEKTAVAIAASCAAPPALRVIADEPAVTAAGFATVPVRPTMASP